MKYPKYPKRILDILAPMEPIVSERVNQCLDVKFDIDVKGGMPVTVTLEEILKQQALIDVHKVNDLQLINIFINGFPGYKDMSVGEFLGGHILCNDNIVGIELLDGNK